MARPRPSARRFNRFALRAWREERGISTTEMATALGVVPGYYCDFESGRKPGTARLIRLAADLLNVSPLVITEENVLSQPEAAAS